jgi:hypothetical protein
LTIFVTLLECLSDIKPNFELILFMLQPAIVQWVMDPAERDAKWAQKAIKEKKEERGALMIIEIACGSSPDHL